MALPSRRPPRMLAPRRSPFRPVIVVLLLLTCLVVALLALGGTRTTPTEARVAALAYLDEVRPLVERSSATGRDLAGVRDDAAQLGRDALDRQLARAEVEAGSVLVEARAVDPPPEAATAQDLLVGVLGARVGAVKALRGAIGQALTVDAPALPAVQALVDVGQDLQAADGAYRLFTRNLPQGGGPVPESRWVPDPEDWSTPVLGAFVTSLRTSQSLAPVHDLSVVLASPDPGPVGKEQGLSVLAAVDRLELQVVVANVGNTAEREVRVVATTQPFDGSTPSQASETIASLAPGQRVALRLEGIDPPAPGVAFAVTVRAGPVEGDANPVDDETTLQLVLR